MFDELRRVALVTSGVAELTRNRAEQIVRDLVKSGDVRRDRASSTVKELVSFAKENRKDVIAMLHSEVRSQIENLGLVSKRDVERLERRITRLEDRVASAGSSSTSNRSTAKKSATKKKSTAKKPTAKKSTAKKTPAKKSSASRVAASNEPQTKGPVGGTTSSGSGSQPS